MKHTNKELLGKGIKYLAGAIPLSGIGPVVLYSAFNNQEHPLYYIVLIAGIATCIGAVFLMFRGISFLIKSLFD